jgi:hypothetical protein
VISVSWIYLTHNEITLEIVRTINWTAPCIFNRWMSHDTNCVICVLDTRVTQRTKAARLLPLYVEIPMLESCCMCAAGLHTRDTTCEAWWMTGFLPQDAACCMRVANPVGEPIFLEMTHAKKLLESICVALGNSWRSHTLHLTQC